MTDLLDRKVMKPLYLPCIYIVFVVTCILMCIWKWPMEWNIETNLPSRGGNRSWRLRKMCYGRLFFYERWISLRCVFFKCSKQSATVTGLELFIKLSLFQLCNNTVLVDWDCTLNRQLVFTTQEVHQWLFAILWRLSFTFSERHVCESTVYKTEVDLYSVSDKGLQI